MVVSFSGATFVPYRCTRQYPSHSYDALPSSNSPLRSQEGLRGHSGDTRSSPLMHVDMPCTFALPCRTNLSDLSERFGTLWGQLCSPIFWPRLFYTASLTRIPCAEAHQMSPISFGTDGTVSRVVMVVRDCGQDPAAAGIIFEGRKACDTPSPPHRNKLL